MRISLKLTNQEKNKKNVSATMLHVQHVLSIVNSQNMTEIYDHYGILLLEE